MGTVYHKELGKSINEKSIKNTNRQRNLEANSFLRKAFLKVTCSSSVTRMHSYVTAKKLTYCQLSTSNK